jgi:hypothetical protein
MHSLYYLYYFFKKDSKDNIKNALSLMIQVAYVALIIGQTVGQ